METIILTTEQLDRVAETTLWELAETAGLLSDAETADVTWYDGEGSEFTLTGHALIIGNRALLWTTCDEAGEDDRKVLNVGWDEHDVRSVTALAREHAEEVASGCGSLEQPVPECSESAHDWQPEQTGLLENPGVHGHGGGVTIAHACVHCGMTRTLDTWADDGRGGHCERTSYAVGA